MSQATAITCTAAEPAAERVAVTPALAGEWLAANTHNRHLRPRVVTAYATDMANGDWQWNGETIKFSRSGVLLDGQHRLAGVVEAGVCVPMLVVRGLPDEVQVTVDGGAKRSLPDILRLRGETNTYQLASIVRKVNLWEAGFTKPKSANHQPTNSELLRTLDAHPELREVANWAASVASGCALPASLIGLCMWVFTEIDGEDADMFFERLRDGQALVKGDPVYELRKATEKTLGGIRGSKRSETYLLAIMIKAWNAYRAGEKVGILRYRPGGASPEKFPEPI